MKLTSIHAGWLKLDGGAMFGIVPKTIWSRFIQPDSNNLCTWAMRCLLIETGQRKILVDTGIGDKQDEKWKSYFEPHGPESLLGSLAASGHKPEDITDVFLTHLHFDHCGGAVSKTAAGNLVPTFPNATYWSNQSHWEWAKKSNPREGASFLRENILPLEEAGVVRWIPQPKESEQNVEWLPGIKARFVYGHTEAMMLLLMDTEQGTFIYCADLLPSGFHLGLPYIMAYDIRPMDTLDEKELLLQEALKNKWYLLFEHDPNIQGARIEQDAKGRIQLGDPFQLEDFFG